MKNYERQIANALSLAARITAGDNYRYHGRPYQVIAVNRFWFKSPIGRKLVSGWIWGRSDAVRESRLIKEGIELITFALGATKIKRTQDNPLLGNSNPKQVAHDLTGLLSRACAASPPTES